MLVFLDFAYQLGDLALKTLTVLRLNGQCRSSLVSLIVSKKRRHGTYIMDLHHGPQDFRRFFICRNKKTQWLILFWGFNNNLVCDNGEAFSHPKFKAAASSWISGSCGTSCGSRNSLTCRSCKNEWWPGLFHFRIYGVFSIIFQW